MRVGNTTAAATAPTGANTVVLFNSFVALLGTTLDTHDLVRYILTVDNNQAGTVNVYRSDDGVTFYLNTQRAVPIPTGPLIDSGPLDFAIDGLKYIRVDWVNGGVTQTTWHPQQELVEKDRAAQT
jgi:hypothetical protein